MNPSVPLLVIFFRQLHVADVLVNTDIDKKMGKEWERRSRVKNSTEKGPDFGICHAVKCGEK